jgi:hypothetical protein
MFQQTLLGLCPITLATAGRHRNTICCHEVQSSPEEAVWCRYQKKKHIGAGHFGEVFQANELCTGRPVAVKHLERLDPEEEGQGDEVSVLRALAHPNLLRIFEVVKFPGEVLIVTELAEQGSLSTFAAAAAAGSQPEGAPWIAGANESRFRNNALITNPFRLKTWFCVGSVHFGGKHGVLISGRRD